MNTVLVRANDIHLTHRTDTTYATPIKINSDSAIALNVPLHVKQYIIDDKFKMLVENNSLVIQKKIDGVFTNYFKLE
jgi:hypothetical protein